MGLLWDRFKTLGDSKIDLKANVERVIANVEKLSYLKLSLKGDALFVTDTNYDIAKRKLAERFNNKRSIVKAHIEAIHALPAIKKESSTEQRKPLESAVEHVQTLKTLMLPVDQ